MEELRNNLDIKKVYGIRYDPNFKTMYSKKKNLKSLFYDVFHENLENFDYHNKEFSKGNIHLRCGYSDMILKTKNRIILLEVQNKNLENFSLRIKRYVSMLYMNQEVSKDYMNILPVEVYIIINYEIGQNKILKEFQELEVGLKEEFDHLSKIKVWSIKEALKEKNKLDFQYARLFILDEYTKEEAIQILESCNLEKRFQELVKGIVMYNMDIKTYRRMEEIKMLETSFELETSMIKANAEKRGEARGEVRGRKIGEREGIRIGKLEDAKNLLQEGIPLDIIVRVTKLSKEQIQKYIGS